MTEQLDLNVNGERRSIDADPLTPLGTILAGTLGLRSVRDPCGVGACGACTVLVDGAPVKACLRPVGLTDGAVTTVDGLPLDDPVIAAFAAHNAFQCGYCIPGFVMAVHGLLAGELPRDQGSIREALAGNLCRCGSYLHILEAVEALVADKHREVAPASGGQASMKGGQAPARGGQALARGC